jgi:hypothetical protein
MYSPTQPFRSPTRLSQPKRPCGGIDGPFNPAERGLGEDRKALPIKRRAA